MMQDDWTCDSCLGETAPMNAALLGFKSRSSKRCCADNTYKGRLRNAAANLDPCHQDEVQNQNEDMVERPVIRNQKNKRAVLKCESIPDIQTRSLLPEDQELSVQHDAWTLEVVFIIIPEPDEERQ